MRLRLRGDLRDQPAGRQPAPEGAARSGAREDAPRGHADLLLARPRRRARACSAPSRSSRADVPLGAPTADLHAGGSREVRRDDRLALARASAAAVRRRSCVESPITTAGTTSTTTPRSGWSTNASWVEIQRVRLRASRRRRRRRSRRRAARSSSALTARGRARERPRWQSWTSSSPHSCPPPA